MKLYRHKSVHERKDRAVVLVLVLWILIVLSLMAYSLLFQVTTEVTITSLRKKQLKAKALARAGIAKSIVDLRNDMIFDAAEETQNFDAEGDVWARKEEGKEDVALSRDEKDGYFNARVYDEEGLFNLNAMNRSSRPLLEAIAEYIGYEEEDAKIVASAIIDWSDPDDVPVLDNSPHNTEGRAYAILRGEDEGGETDPDDVQPISFRNEYYLTVDELLEVYGVTPALFFGPGTEEAEYYAKKIGGAAGDRFVIKERRRSRLDDSPPVGLRDFFTIHGNRTLNANTAPAHVLAIFAEMTGLDDGDRFADRVIRTRRGGRDKDIDNSDAFKDRGEVMANSEIQSIMQAGGVSYPIGVNSTAFRIISEGVVGDVRSRMAVIVVREMRIFQRDEDFEYIDRARERRDRNSGRTERRQSRRDERQVLYPWVRIVQAYDL